MHITFHKILSSNQITTPPHIHTHKGVFEIFQCQFISPPPSHITYRNQRLSIWFISTKEEIKSYSMVSSKWLICLKVKAKVHSPSTECVFIFLTFCSLLFVTVLPAIPSFESQGQG